MQTLEADEDESSVAALVAGVSGEDAAEREGEAEPGESDAAPAQKAKFDPATSAGIHLGYHFLPGGKPNGDYRVIEFSHLARLV